MGKIRSYVNTSRIKPSCEIQFYKLFLGTQRFHGQSKLQVI